MQVQAAYRVELRSLSGQPPLRWDSGTVAGADSLSVAYTGPPLRPHTLYEWNVTTTNAVDTVARRMATPTGASGTRGAAAAGTHGCVSAPSAPARVITANGDFSSSRAIWLGRAGTSAQPGRGPGPGPGSAAPREPEYALFRREVALRAPRANITSAIAFVAATAGDANLGKASNGDVEACRPGARGAPHSPSRTQRVQAANSRAGFAL